MPVDLVEGTWSGFDIENFCDLSAKRPRLESSKKKDFDAQAATMSEWLDKTEINLELLTTDPPNPEEKLTLEEQMVLIKASDLREPLVINTVCARIRVRRIG